MCKVRIFCSDPIGIKTFRVSELMINIDDETPPITTRTGFHHEINGELASETDKSIVPRFGDDKDVLNGGLYFSSTCSVLDCY